MAIVGEAAIFEATGTTSSYIGKNTLVFHDFRLEKQQMPLRKILAPHSHATRFRTWMGKV